MAQTTRNTAAADGSESIDKLTLELRRGVIVLACLSQLKEPSYGYELQQRLADAGMPIEQGTLYPLLRRLEGQGLLVSEWRIDDGPPRRYYTLSANGAEAYRDVTSAWASLTSVVDRLLDEES